MRQKTLSIFNFDQKKIAVRRIVSVICVVTILLGGLYYADRLLIKKNSYRKFEPFFQNDQEFDVLFFGSSHMRMGVSTLKLFHDYGITGYNLATDGNYILSNYYLLKDILNLLLEEERQLPKIVVMDIYEANQELGYLHSTWDCFPISDNKIEMVNKLVAEEDRAEMLAPFSLYHNRWNEITKEDFHTDISELYGSDPGGYKVSYPGSEIVLDRNDKLEMREETAFYIDLMKKECDALDIQLILIHIPYSYNPIMQRRANGISQYAEEQGILFKNYMDPEIGIDYDIDFHDTGHLNSVGMGIITGNVGRLLVKEGLRDHRDEPQEQQWNQAYDNYKQYMFSRIIGFTNVKSYLMSINDAELFSEIQVKEDILKDVQIAKLIDRLREEGNQITVTEEKAENVIGGGAKCEGGV